MATIYLGKITLPENAPAGMLGLFVTDDNEAFLVDENGAIYAFSGGATNLLALTDFPNSYVGQALKALRVNAAANALEFIDFPQGFDGNPSSLNQEGATDGQAILWDAYLGLWVPADVFDGNPSSLNQEGATDGEVIAWDDYLGMWVPTTIGGGGTWGGIIGNIEDQADLWNILVSTVRITGNQTIEGIKTFSSSPIVPYPETEFQAVNKGYVDSVIGEGTFIRTPQTFIYDGSNTVTLDFIPDDMLFVSLNGQLTDRWERTGDQLTVTDFAEGDFIIIGYYKSMVLLPDLPEDRIESFSLNVVSDILGEVTATWFDFNVEHSVTDYELVFAGTPESGDFRWDLIKLNFDGSVSVITGTEGTEPVRPTTGTDGLIGAELIWNDLGEFVIIEPSVIFPNDRYFTKPKANNQGNFAKVLSGPLAKGQMYSLQLSYTNYSSEWGTQGKGDTGTLNVTFLTNNSNNINSTSVKIETVAGNSEVGDWVLVDATGGLWELWHKSKAFWGRTQYRIVFFNDVVNKDWFIQDAPYVASIPANDAEYPSVPYHDFTDYEPSTGNILFSPLNGKPRKYGFTTALTGNITFETTGAKETGMAKFKWNGGTLPTVSVSGGGVTLVKIGEFEVSVDNFVDCVCHKNDAGTVTHIVYAITQV